MSKTENRINKARYWTAVLYPENMVKDWELLIGDIVFYEKNANFSNLPLTCIFLI